MAVIHPQPIEGHWRSGKALDFHTGRSVHVGDDADGRPLFEMTYTAVGWLLHRLKYRSDQGAASDIITTASHYLMPRKVHFDMIVPVPPSAKRPVQPVLVLANGIGKEIGLPVVACVTATRPATQMKSIDDPEKRRQALIGLYAVDRAATQGKRILLFDDLFRSGATMNAVTDLLLGPGGAANVDAFTITRTRVNR